MMATYFNGGCSEIQADNLQTLYLMNPSYSVDSQTPPGLLFLNPGSHQQHLVGIPLAPSESANHYNLWGGAVNAGPSSSGDVGSPVGFRRPHQISLEHHHHHRQGLSLSLNNSPAHKNAAGASGVGSPTSASGVSGGGQSGILGSKYMKVAQELLDEVVNVGKVTGMVGLGVMEKAKGAMVSGEDGSSGGGGGCAESKGGSAVAAAAELSTAQRQELQMKKAKLLNMLDEVEQRYRQYHSQMQMVASSYEQAAGSGSAKSYTALALHTISKQFRCLKDAIASQIKATGKSLGEEDGKGEGSSAGRSRLRLVDQQMRQQRAALQQLGMMQQHPHNAWRPQRGLPEKAVSVLRAWLFEHFLHPYPKDSDKHTLAKQTGLTRSQVSNWFINARVRLWKPMVEEMYLEETKGAKHQNDSEEHTTPNNNKNNNDDPNKESPPTLHSPRITQNPKLPPPPTNSINDIPNSTIVSPPTGPTRHAFEPPAALQGFSLIRQPSIGIESSMMISPKRQRSNIVVDIQNNSPSSILSMDHHMEMKDNSIISRGLFSAHHPGFGSNYPVGDIGSRLNPDQQLGHGKYYHGGNAVSLTLGLPHCENMLSSLSSGTHHHHHHHHQQNFMHGQAVQLGRRLDIGIGEAEFCSPQPSHSGVGGGSYEGVDIQNRKRFAAQLLSDFVA